MIAAASMIPLAQAAGYPARKAMGDTGAGATPLCIPIEEGVRMLVPQVDQAGDLP